MIIVGILVLGGGGLGIYFLTKSDDTGSQVDGSDPKAVAERFASVYQNAVNTDLDGFDVGQFKPVMCGADYERVREETDRTLKNRETKGRKPSKRPASERLTIGVKDLKVEGDKGTFALAWKEPDGDDKERELHLEKASGNWVVCGLYDKLDDSPPSSSRRPLPTTRSSR